MKVLITGATGMIGSGALLECLDDPEITEVRVLVRRPLDREHPKLVQVVHSDFSDFSEVEDQLSGLDACLWCLGVSAAGMSEEAYRRITVDFTRAGAEALLRLSPGVAMCFISGGGTSRDSRQMWARVKAEAEDLLLGMGFERAVMFRPAAIQPMRGVKSQTTSYRVMYVAMAWFWPLLRLVVRKQVTDSITLGRALIHAARHGAPKPVLENHEINELVAG